VSTNFVRFTGEPKYSKIEKKKIFLLSLNSHIFPDYLNIVYCLQSML